MYEVLLHRYHFSRGEFAMSSVNTSSRASVPSPVGSNSGDRILGALQSVGRSLMLPIAVLPAAALLLRFGQPELLNLP
jgi:PTS system N-acetylglucosamine-specific IIC component